MLRNRSSNSKIFIFIQQNLKNKAHRTKKISIEKVKFIDKRKNTKRASKIIRKTFL
jgi:hypothetical protein